MPAPRILLLGVTIVTFVAASTGCGGNGGGSNSESKEIRRAPQTGVRAPEPKVGPLRVAAAGDFGIEAPGVATLDAMAKFKPDIYLALGDFSYAGPTSAPRFCRLVRSKVGPAAPVEIVSGNHEEDPGEDGPLRDYVRCLPDRLNAVGHYGRQYYFDLGRLVRFIMISPDLTIDGVHYYYGDNDAGTANARLAWLRRTIQSARAAGIEWVVVGMHKPCITVGVYYCDVFQDLFSTLIAKKVDLVLSGHDHTYQRSKQISTSRDGCKAVIVDRFDPDCVVDDDNSYRKGAGSTFVVSGAAGAGLYPVHANDPEAGYFVTAMGKNRRSRHGFAMLTISRRKLAARFVGSTPGSFADRFEIASEGAGVE